MLLNAIQADPVMLHQFVERADESLLEVNDQLKSLSDHKSRHTLREVMDQVGRIIHAFKGDASALGLTTLSELVHAFETELQRIRAMSPEDPALGDALLSLPMPLDDLLDKVTALKALIMGFKSEPHAAVSHHVSESSHAALDLNIRKTIENLVQAVAQDEGKEVIFNSVISGLDTLDASTQVLVREMAIQLARNAVVHGLETPAHRAEEGKSPAGRIDVLFEKHQGKWRLLVRDDGAGISPDAIRERLIKSGKFSPETVHRLDDHQVIQTIFKSGVSTLDTISLHAGRGVGLDIVTHNVRRLSDPQLKVRSRVGQYTEFLIQFAA